MKETIFLIAVMVIILSSSSLPDNAQHIIESTASRIPAGIKGGDYENRTICPGFIEHAEGKADNRPVFSFTGTLNTMHSKDLNGAGIIPELHLYGTFVRSMTMTIKLDSLPHCEICGLLSFKFTNT